MEVGGAHVEVRFVHLPEKDIYLNLQAIKRFNPQRSNRIDYIDGDYEQISEGDALALKNALEWLASPQIVVQAEEEEPKPRRRGRPRKNAKAGKDAISTPTRIPKETPTT